ncbi:MAG: hypothetical protein ACXABF_17245 [Candidatus Thorarchaeota archaeon]|jgi:hypothetical protein
MEVTLEFKFSLVQANSEEKLRKKVNKKRKNNYITSGPVRRTRVGRKVIYTQYMVKYPTLPE